MKFLAKLVFWVSGWKVVGEIPPGKKRFVMVAAPHTSNWDLLYARSAFYLLNVNMKYTIKKELFFFPLGLFLKALGGIPINRKKKQNMISYMASLFNESEEFVLLVTPEATRSYAKEWKKGFYYIAQEAKVPIVLGFLDYKEKQAGIGPIVDPTGNYEEDMKYILNFYRSKTGKFPENGVL